MLVAVLWACSKDESFDASMFPQEWKLVMMGNERPYSSTSGAAMEWQEKILLHPDDRFVKRRMLGGITTEAAGSYLFSEAWGAWNGTYLVLTYDEPNELVASCSSDQQEHLKLANPGQLLGTWAACDGPFLIYERIR